MIQVQKQPSSINPVYADNEFIFVEAGATYFNVEITGTVERTFKIYADVNGKATLDMTYILKSYVEPRFAPETSGEIPLAMLEYSLSVGSDLSAAQTVGTFDYYYGSRQPWEATPTYTYHVLNNLRKSSPIVYDVYRTDTMPQAVQFIKKPGDGASSYKVTNKNGTVTTVTVTEPTKPVIYNIVIEYNTVQIEVVNVGFFVVHENTNQTRYEPYIFKYVNNNGGTDYVTFSLANSEEITVTKYTIEHDRATVVYDRYVDRTFTVISEEMSEEQSKLLESLWYSEKVALWENESWVNVIVVNKKVSILRKKEQGLIYYTIQFQYADKGIY